MDKEVLSGVKKAFLVLSGKGGVGKSTVSTQLALTLKDKGHKVGLLDIDLCGPSVPYILGLENNDVHQCPEGWVPVYPDSDKKLAVMSIGFLLKNRNDAVIWRGPKKTAMIKQFVTDVYWQDIEYLIIDTPPGTSDEHITIMEMFKNYLHCPHAAIIVTSPQEVSIEDVRKEVTFCKKTNIPILGIIENMSGYECPNCKECTNIFSAGGGEALASMCQIPFVGALPIDPRVGMLQAKSSWKEYPESETATIFNRLAEDVIVWKNK